MRNMLAVASGILAIGSFGAVASATVYFQDSFDNKTEPLGAPEIGIEYTSGESASLSQFTLDTSPAIGVKSIGLHRDGTDGTPDLHARGLEGALVVGKTIEFSWDNYISHVHRYNAPIQVHVGFLTGGVGQLNFIGNNDANSGSYFYSDLNGNQISTGVQPTLNGWDRLRAVFTLADSGYAGYMTGTMDLYVSLNGAPEQQLVNDVQLGYAEMPANDDPMTPYDDRTVPLLRIQKGPYSGVTYYDNLYIGDPIVAPSASVWNVNADGNWSAAGNWSGGVPNGADAIANFGTIITSAHTVTLDATQTVGTINFSSPVAYTIAGTNTLTLDVSSGQAAINVTAGSHLIDAPVVLAKDTTVSVSSGAALSVQSVRGAGLNVASGAMKITAKGTANSANGTSKLTSLAIGSGGSLDLTNNSLVIDYATVGTLVDDTRQMLAGGKLKTTASGGVLGYGDNAILGKASFGGQAVDGTSLLVKFTYAGDANLDGQVDITDLGLLATNWQTNNVWTGGDFDYSAFVDISDLGILATNWQLGVGSPLGPGFDEALASVGLGGVSVPEPGALGLLLLSFGLIAPRKRGR